MLAISGGSGFIGGIIAGFLAGYLTQGIKYITRKLASSRRVKTNFNLSSAFSNNYWSFNGLCL